ncbi:MFS transporter [Nocardia flavorosea]|uniref:MFS transporter n=1 Tax=Nocardia flavorosea TaxID=53429 RepID=UPI002456747F|nr:MFS transporter [Nocardia flavorosea]
MSTLEVMDPPVGGWTWAQRRTVVVSCLAVTLVIASMAALYTSLAEISIATGASHTQTTWIVDGYTLALACMVLPAGALGDRYGRRRLLIGGLLVFAVASTVPLATSAVDWLIGARVLAGLGAALVMPSTLSMITTVFPPGASARAVGVWAGAAGSGGLLGLVGSGLLLQWWSWQSIFVAMAGAAVVLAAAGFGLAESRSTTPAGLDPIGALTGVAAIALLVWSLIAVADRGWSDPYILAGLASSALATELFVLTELRVRYPLLDLRLFARRGFGCGAASITVQFLITFGLFLIVVQYLQLILGYSPLHAAVAVLPMGIAVVALSLLSSLLTTRYGLRLPTVAGLTVLAAGLLLMTRLTPDAGYPGVLIPLTIVGIGIGLAAAPATTAIMTDADTDRHSVAAAVNDAAREIGAAIGIAVAGTVLTAGYRAGVATSLPRLPEPAREPVAHSLGATTQLAEQAGPQAQPLLDLARSAFVDGLHDTVFALAIIGLFAAVVLGFWAPGPRKAPRPAGTEPGGPRNLQLLRARDHLRRSRTAWRTRRP